MVLVQSATSSVNDAQCPTPRPSRNLSSRSACSGTDTRETCKWSVDTTGTGRGVNVAAAISAKLFASTPIITSGNRSENSSSSATARG